MTSWFMCSPLLSFQCDDVSARVTPLLFGFYLEKCAPASKSLSIYLSIALLLLLISSNSYATYQWVVLVVRVYGLCQFKSRTHLSQYGSDKECHFGRWR